MEILVCSLFFSLALASLNKHTEAGTYYKKALELDPDNDTYKTNLKIAEEKMETSSPVRTEKTFYTEQICRDMCVLTPPPLSLSQTAAMGGVDLAGLLGNPGFMNMVRAHSVCFWTAFICPILHKQRLPKSARGLVCNLYRLECSFS